MTDVQWVIMFKGCGFKELRVSRGAHFSNVPVRSERHFLLSVTSDQGISDSRDGVPQSEGLTTAGAGVPAGLLVLRPLGTDHRE